MILKHRPHKFTKRASCLAVWELRVRKPQCFTCFGGLRESAHPLQKSPNLTSAPVRLRGGSGKLWASSGRPWEVSGGALGELRGLSIYTNSRSTAQRPLC